MISFALVIGLGGIITAFSINRATHIAFSKMVREGDITIAEELADTLGLYYKENGSWKDVDEIVFKPYQHIYLRSRPMGKSERNPVRGQQMQGVHIVITDDTGNVIVSTGEYRKNTEIPVDKGIPIYSDSRVTGYVFVGSMIGAGLLPFQEEFLKSSANAIFLSLISMIVIAIIVGFFLIRHITFPVKKLTEASKSIAGGNLKAAVDLRRNDELGELALSFNKMAESLQRAEEWKKQIIADTAHELRTPLSLIQGRLEMMLDGVYPVDSEGIKIVYEETLMLTTLIGELSELSNAEAGEVSLHLERMSVESLLEFSREYFLPAAEERNISLTVESGKNIPEIMMDLQKMNQVIANLISNAVRYTPEGGSIILSSLYDENTGLIEISVEDSGPGIPEKERSRIFNRLYRIDSHRNRNSGGSGLGLAISREIVKLHGGTIRAEEGKILGGARIVISLPVKE